MASTSPLRRIGLVLVALLLLASTAHALTVPVVAESVQGSMATPSQSVSIGAGAPRNFIVNILSSTWQTVGSGVDRLDILIERSLDGGATWQPVAGGNFGSGATKGGAAPFFQVSWDGQASLIRIGHVLTTVNGVSRYTSNDQTGVVTDQGGADPTFTWGLSVTI